MISIYQAIVDLQTSDLAGALCTIIRTRGSTPRHAASKMLVYPDGKILGSVGGGGLEQLVVAAALDSIKDGQTRMLEYNMVDPSRGDIGVCGGMVEVFVEPILPKPVLAIIGAGHVGKAVAHLAKWLGFHVVVSDDRTEFCTPDAVPEADEYVPCAMADLPKKFTISTWTYLVLTTRGVDVDIEGLPALLETPAAYLGVIGSRRRWAETRKKLLGVGISDEKLSRVISPVGLKIHAETPEEIAVSILGEIISLRHQKSP